ncbi:MAG: helix-turn-helix transcriptional regulator [Ignavibacteriae bacterium]|nr:helix-turn-helix transcriptional regulator [Ignavibacteriota bacterium]
MKTRELGYPEIGAIVRFHRKKAGLTQNALAELAGVGKTVVFDIEKNKESVQLDSLRKILRALNIKVVFESPLMDELRKAGDEKG